jgi:glycosyltransferase involved in cell wall biosynthesis
MIRDSGTPDRVVVINDDAVEQGGAATIAVASARLLRQRGIPVTFLSGSDAIDPDLAASGVEVSCLSGRLITERSAGSAIVRGLFDRNTRAALRRWLDRYDTPGTVYHLHNWHKALTPSVFTVLRRIAPRLVISAHDFFLACPNGAFFLYPQQRECQLAPNSLSCVASACDRRNYRHKLWRVARHELRHRLFDLTKVDALVVAVHEAMVPLLTRGPLDAARIRVIRNPVTPWHSIRVPAESNRDVVFVGRLDGEKGVDRLARAAQRLGAPLRVIGDGPLHAEIARLCPSAELLGWCGRHQIAELTRSARIVVSPTLSREAFGLVALEALTSGIPVIVPQNSPFADEIVTQGFGLACDPNDQVALADAIELLSRDDRLIGLMSQRAFSAARQLAPTPERWCDELLALYRGLLTGEHVADHNRPIVEQGPMLLEGRHG